MDFAESQTARGHALPLGRVYVGMTAAWTSLLLIASAVPAFSAGRLPGGSALCAVAIVAAVSGLGILRRRRFGVVALWLMYAMLILMTPFLEPMPDQPVLMAIRATPASLPELAGQAKSFSSVVSLVFGAVYFVATFIYFKHRFSSMKSD